MKSRHESGFTMVEMVIATAVTGIIIAFLGTSIHQMFAVTGYGNERLLAMHELQHAAYWFNHDGQRAVAADAGGELTFTLSEDSAVTYSLSDTELRRTNDGAAMLLAQHITAAEFSLEGRIVTMSLTSSPDGRYGVAENATYKVLLRSMEGA